MEPSQLNYSLRKTIKKKCSLSCTNFGSLCPYVLHCSYIEKPIIMNTCLQQQTIYEYLRMKGSEFMSTDNEQLSNKCRQLAQFLSPRDKFILQNGKLKNI